MLIKRDRNSVCRRAVATAVPPGAAGPSMEFCCESLLHHIGEPIPISVTRNGSNLSCFDIEGTGWAKGIVTCFGYVTHAVTSAGREMEFMRICL